ncbi:tRNA pseudouridine synthase-like 1 [Tubulanus polymorphus]|uniref:tRNA pseudouridine synthase-like 1 n=1 Tax=Tubulanus polymorphus TaxID=672921 RepID=UPI003DA1C985
MGRFLIYFSYIGSKYSGVQKSGLPSYLKYGKAYSPHTVVGVIEDALNIFKPANDFKVVTSSRTDAGVHSLCNTVHCDLIHPDEPDVEFDPDLLCRGLNAFFHHAEEPIRALKVRRVPDDFHSRFDAISRTYVYKLAVLHDNSLHGQWTHPFTPFDYMSSHIVFPPFDPEKAKAALAVLNGRHNFYAFSTKRNVQPWQSRVKNLRTYFQYGSLFMEEYNRLGRDKHVNIDLIFNGSSFLYRQVRKMVCAVLNVARGYFSLDELKMSLKKPHMYQGHHMITSCPAHGLYLIDVEYDENKLRYERPSQIKTDPILTLPEWEDDPSAMYKKYDELPYTPDTTPQMEERERENHITQSSAEKKS